MWIASRVEREAKAKVTFPSTSVAKDQWFNIARNKIIAGNGQR